MAAGSQLTRLSRPPCVAPSRMPSPWPGHSAVGSLADFITLVFMLMELAGTSGLERQQCSGPDHPL